MQCPNCQIEAPDTHFYCPECRTILGRPMHHGEGGETIAVTPAARQQANQRQYSKFHRFAWTSMKLISLSFVLFASVTAARRVDWEEAVKAVQEISALAAPTPTPIVEPAAANTAKPEKARRKAAKRRVTAQART